MQAVQAPDYSVCAICNQPKKRYPKHSHESGGDLAEVFKRMKFCVSGYEPHPECEEAETAFIRERDEKIMAEQAEESRLKHLHHWRHQSNHPVEMTSLVFETFKTDATNEKAVKMLQAWTLDDDFGFLISGPSGCGKSHLGFALYQKIAELLSHIPESAHPPIYQTPSYYQVSELLAAVRRNDFDLPRSVMSIAPLFLDDLGTENCTEWSREILYRLFEHRLSQKYVTIVTTNLTMAELKERLHERIASRILGQCVPVFIKGKDMRAEQMKAKFKAITDRL